jgi:hypothetical protein
MVELGVGGLGSDEEVEERAENDGSDEGETITTVTTTLTPTTMAMRDERDGREGERSSGRKRGGGEGLEESVDMEGTVEGGGNCLGFYARKDKIGDTL